MSNGVVYLVWGAAAREQAARSIASLRQFSQVPVLVIGDKDAKSLSAEHHLCRVKPFGRDKRFYAGRVKPLMYGLSPFERTLYVDADTEFIRDPAPGFDLLDRWEVLVTDTGHRSLADNIAGKEEAPWTRDWFGTPHLLYHNSGMIFWRHSESVKDLFHLWGEEWARFKGWDEQLALLKALARSHVRFLTLPSSWNTKYREQAYMLHHAFGSGVARGV